MTSVERFEDLDVWKRARALANLVYSISEEGAFARDFSFRDQMRRAAVSILSNIAEGFENRTQALFVDYLGRAKASAGELRAQAYLALDRHYVNEKQFEQIQNEAQVCSRQIVGLIRYLESVPNSRRVREPGAVYDV